MGKNIWLNEEVVVVTVFIEWLMQLLVPHNHVLCYLARTFRNDEILQLVRLYAVFHHVLPSLLAYKHRGDPSLSSTTPSRCRAKCYTILCTTSVVTRRNRHSIAKT